MPDRDLRDLRQPADLARARSRRHAGSVPRGGSDSHRTKIGAWTKAFCSCSSARILAGSIVVALGAARTGLPVLSAFLAIGMLLGSDGPGGIDFDDAELAREVGIIGLALILYEGGLQTSWRRLREVAVPAALLSTVGVVVSALLTGAAAYVLFDLSWLESVLLGAVVSSTDAAAVFATLRFTHIRRRLARTLEAESGGNDPMAIALTLGLIAWIERPNAYGFDDLFLLVVQQLGLGLVVGVAFGALASWVFGRLPHSIGAFAPVASLAAAALAFGARRRDRRQRLPLRLPRRPRGREHAVPLPPPPRLLPRGTRLRRAGGALHRPRPARVPLRPARRGGARPRARARADARRPPRLRFGVDLRERLHQPRTSPARLGGLARRRADRPRDVRPLVRRAEQGDDLQRRLLRRRRLGGRAGDDARARRRPSRVCSRPRRPCTRRRSRWGR